MVLALLGIRDLIFHSKKAFRSRFGVTDFLISKPRNEAVPKRTVFLSQRPLLKG